MSIKLLRLKREDKVRGSIFSDLLTRTHYKFIKVFFNHLQFKTYPHLLRKLMKKENFKFFSNSDFMPKQLLQPSNVMMESSLMICLKIYFNSKRFSPRIKSSKIVSRKLLEKLLNLAKNCLKKECKVLKKRLEFQRITTSPKKTFKISNHVSSKQKQLLTHFIKRSRHLS